MGRAAQGDISAANQIENKVKGTMNGSKLIPATTI